jgi:hypothetical protein
MSGLPGMRVKAQLSRCYFNPAKMTSAVLRRKYPGICLDIQDTD